MKRIIEKIIFECRMIKMDIMWRFSKEKRKSKYPPSFFHRNSKERIREILEEEERKELQELRDIAEKLNNYRRKHGLPEKDYKKEWAI